jgi:hypothetical protein
MTSTSSENHLIVFYKNKPNHFYFSVTLIPTVAMIFANPFQVLFPTSSNSFAQKLLNILASDGGLI